MDTSILNSKNFKKIASMFDIDLDTKQISNVSYAYKDFYKSNIIPFNSKNIIGNYTFFLKDNSIKGIRIFFKDIDRPCFGFGYGEDNSNRFDFNLHILGDIFNECKNINEFEIGYIINNSIEPVVVSPDNVNSIQDIYNSFFDSYKNVNFYKNFENHVLIDKTCIEKFDKVIKTEPYKVLSRTTSREIEQTIKIVPVVEDEKYIVCLMTIKFKDFEAEVTPYSGCLRFYVENDNKTKKNLVTVNYNDFFDDEKLYSSIKSAKKA